MEKIAPAFWWEIEHPVCQSMLHQQVMEARFGHQRDFGIRPSLANRAEERYQHHYIPQPIGHPDPDAGAPGHGSQVADGQVLAEQIALGLQS